MTILAKKDDDSRNNDKKSESKPKIILKAKEKEQPINIATRDWNNEAPPRISVQVKEPPPIIGNFTLHSLKIIKTTNSSRTNTNNEIKDAKTS